MKGEIVFNKKLSDKYYYMKIKSPDFVKNAKPGQFFMLKTQSFDYLVDPLLRRPFGICDIDNDCFTLLYILIGKGTYLLSNLHPGTIISFSTPLGNPFTIVKNSKVALIGGGVGIAPLLFLAKTLKSNNNFITLYYGGKTKDDIHLIEEFEKYCDNILISTEDGSIGSKGVITDLIKNFDYDIVYSCGPKPMMKAVINLFKNKVSKIEVSLDERMACGLGACLGCIVYLKDGEKIVQKRCCIEGPVFDGYKIVWEH